jgi:hypothetical protein
MPYEKLVQQAQPALIQMILDDSASMKSAMPGSSKTRYELVEQYAGVVLNELISRSTHFDASGPVVVPRFFLDLIKYGNTVEPWSTSELDIGTVATRFDAEHGSFGLGGALNGTDAAKAFQVAYDRLEGMLSGSRYRASFPPMVFHLTDGESRTDASELAQKITSLATTDGNVLLVNAYIGTLTDLAYDSPQNFPGYLTEAEVGTNEDNLRLFRMSSVVPDTIHENLTTSGIFPQLRPGVRLFFDVRTQLMLKNVLAVVGSVGGSRTTA